MADRNPGVKSQSEIREWLRTAIANEVLVDPASLDPARPFAYYGLDSLTAATLSGDLSDWIERDIPADLLLEHPTIDALSAWLAAGSPASPQPVTQSPAAAAAERPASDEGSATQDRLLRSLVRLFVRLSSRVELEGRERLDVAGPALFACNHLHILDAVWMAAVLPARTRFLVAGNFRHKPVVGRLLVAGRSVFIERGRADRDARDEAVGVLQRGGVVGVAPEGRLSRTGGLIRGQSGIAYLSGQSGVPVIPVAAYGQERAGASWLRLSRVRVSVRVGPPIAPPAMPASARDFERHADAVMRAIAELLPSAYRGIYEDARAE